MGKTESNDRHVLVYFTVGIVYGFANNVNHIQNEQQSCKYFSPQDLKQSYEQNVLYLILKLDLL